MSRKPIIFESDQLMVRRQQRLNRLLRLAVVLTVTVLVALTSLYFYTLLAREEQTARTRLRTFAELRASTLQRHFAALSQETALWATQENMKRLMRRFVEHWRGMTPQERDTVRRMLSPVRTRPGAHTDNLNTTRTNAVNAFLALYRNTVSDMQAFLDHHGYANIHFLTPQGDLIFSVHKRADFGHNMSVNGSIYAGRSLGQTFQRALRLISPGYVIFHDFSPYPAASDPPRAFFAAPLLELEGEKIGVMIIEQDITPINRLLSVNGALGRDAMVYAVGPDLLLRNDLPGRPHPTALHERMDTPAVRKALDGERATIIWKKNGRKFIAVAAPMDFNDTRWAVVTEMPLDDMRAPYRPYAVLWALSVALILLLGAVQYWLFRRG